MGTTTDSRRGEAQYRARPEGPHCENTKIWFYCNMAAALGVCLYDKVYNKQTHAAAANFSVLAEELRRRGSRRCPPVGDELLRPIVNWS